MRDPAKGLRKQLKTHKEKLEAYKSDPDKFDNKGFLKNADPARREKIIKSRIKNLEKQIEAFEQQIEEIESGEGN